MGRRERRAAERASALDSMIAERRRCAECRKMYEQAAEEVRQLTIHHISGELYTAMALILRRHPYRWPRDKVMRYLSQVGAIINDINEGTIHDSDLVTEGEKYGIRVLWDAEHKYIDEMDIFEEAD